jgi:hypothetical protein
MNNPQCEERMIGKDFDAGSFFPVFVGALSPENPSIEFSWSCFKRVKIEYQETLNKETKEISEIVLKIDP